MGDANYIAYPSRETLARLLDCGESTIDGWVKRGVLPPPIKFPTGVVRWDWLEVQSAINALKATAGPAVDPMIEGARRVAQEIAAKRHGRAA